MTWSVEWKDYNCEACVYGKMSKNSFPKMSENHAKKPFDLVHSDLCGPMQVTSKGGSKYMLTFTDDFSRYTTVYFLKNKNETLERFKEYVNSIATQHGEQIKVIRTDNGGEYKSKKFSQFCASIGVAQQFTTR